MLGFRFCIDTGQSPAVHCPQTRYGIHESPIIMKHVEDLLANNQIIRRDEGAWLCKGLLAPKPHQEHVNDIKDFVWRFCINYRPLNAVTQPFLFPIPRCDDTLDDFGDGSGRPLYFISFDAKSGYHQIAVWDPDKKKLAFFAPDNLKYVWEVMPFGPLNAPAVYTAIMTQIRQESYDLFCLRFPDRAKEVDSKQIVDDGLMWSYDPFLLLDFFDCICEIYVKYRLSFNLKKCDFYMPRFEWIGHDLTQNGNNPAQSKFDLVRDWPIPRTGSLLNSFVGFAAFYAMFIPQFAFRVSPLRSFARKFHRLPIPPHEWTPKLDAAFTDLKQAIVSDPCLARYDSNLPVFLKTDWSGAGMSYILMQPANNTAAQEALALLQAGGDNLFDTMIQGARLRPVRFGSRKCTRRESFLHSFFGEAGAGRWSMGQCRRYLWGAHFYWFCDCKDVQAILFYEGPIHALSRLAQELFAYNFTCLHRPARMMVDVDALNRLYDKCDPLIKADIVLTQQASADHQAASPFAYDAAAFPDHALRCPATAPSAPAQTLITRARYSPAQARVCITSLTAPVLPAPSSSPPSLSSFYCSPPAISLLTRPALPFDKTQTNKSLHALAASHSSFWLSVHSRTGSIAHGLARLNPHTAALPVLLLEDSSTSVALCKSLLPSASVELLPTFSLLPAALSLDGPDGLLSPELRSTLRSTFNRSPSILGLDLHCTTLDPLSQMRWLETALAVIDQVSQAQSPPSRLLPHFHSSSSGYRHLSYHSCYAASLAVRIPMATPLRPHLYFLFRRPRCCLPVDPLRYLR